MHRIGLCLFKVHNIHFEVKMFTALWYTCSMSYNRVCHHYYMYQPYSCLFLSGHPDSKEIDVAESTSCL